MLAILFFSPLTHVPGDLLKFLVSGSMDYSTDYFILLLFKL